MTKGPPFDWRNPKIKGSAFEFGGFRRSFLPGSFFWQTFMAKRQPSSGGCLFLARTTVEKAPRPIPSKTSKRSSASRVSLTDEEAVTSDLDLPRDDADNDRVNRDDVRDSERDQLFRRGSSLFAVFGSSSCCFLLLRRGLDRPKRERGIFSRNRLGVSGHAFPDNERLVRSWSAAALSWF